MMTFNIRNQHWYIEVVPAHDPGLWVDGTPRTGATWPVTCKIYVSDELNEDQGYRVILHELTHAFIAATQVHSPDSWTEEAVCEMVSIYGDEIIARANVLTGGLYGKVNPGV